MTDIKIFITLLFLSRSNGMTTNIGFSVVESLTICKAEEHYLFAHSLGLLTWILLDSLANSLSFIPLVITIALTLTLTLATSPYTNPYTSQVCHVHTMPLLMDIFYEYIK
jgi:hypothetical protein